jgi:hypothetical protein
MLRYRGLLQTQGQDNIAYGPFLQREIVQYFPAAGFGDRVEGVGRCGCARHEPIIYAHMGICQANILSAPLRWRPRMAQIPRRVDQAPKLVHATVRWVAAIVKAGFWRDTISTD